MKIASFLVFLMLISSFASILLKKMISKRVSLTEKSPGIFLRTMLKISRTTSTVTFTIATLQWLVYIMSLLFELINSCFITLIKNKSASSYLSLTILMIILTYFPGGVGKVLIIFKRDQEEKVFTKACNLLRPKLWVFLLSFLFVLISSLENFLERNLISNLQWMQIKPVILQAVVTVIAFDRLVKLFKEEKPGLQSDIKGLTDRFEKWIKSPM